MLQSSRRLGLTEYEGMEWIKNQTGIFRTQCCARTGSKVSSLSQGLEWEGNGRKVGNLGRWGGYLKTSTTIVCLGKMVAGRVARIFTSTIHLDRGMSSFTLYERGCTLGCVQHTQRQRLRIPSHCQIGQSTLIFTQSSIR